MNFGRYTPLCILASSLVGLLASTATPAAETGRAAGSCFEIIVPQRDMQPASPLLFNKCTGATWLLVRSPAASGGANRSGRPGYRWVSLEVDDPSPSAAKGGTADASIPAAGPARPDEKCFEFTGRRFCE